MERTFLAIKPDGVQRGLVADIIARFEEKGYKLVGMKMMVIGRELAETHYGEHKGKPFFDGLVSFITSGPIVAMAWEGPNVIATARKMMGATNPANAEGGTIRGRFATDVGRNVIHGSDGPEAAARELGIFFQPGELFDWKRTNEPWIRGVLPALLVVLAAAPAYADEPGEVEPRYEAATVLRVAPGETASTRLVAVRLTGGEGAGREVTIVQQLSGQPGFDLPVDPGDGVVVAVLPGEGGEPDYQIADYQRGGPVGWLAAAVALLLVAVGGLRGVKTLVVLGGTLAMLAGVLLPLTLRGWPPVPVAIALAAAIGLFTTLLTAGLGRKSWAAVAGTTAAVAVAGTTALVVAGWARLSGMADADMAVHGAGAIDFAGLLAAGMLLGATGVILDLALSISAAVTELAAENPGMDPPALRRAGMMVGRDLLSTTANTLLLAYMGGFLPVLLALAVHPPPGIRLVHLEAIASEGVTLLVGLLGLAIAVPVTAWLAALGSNRA